MKRIVKKVAVLGAGIMGARIACHFANTGVDVLLLDIVTPDGGNGQPVSNKNDWVNTSLDNALKSKPSPLFVSAFASRIATGNFEDDFSQIGQADWVIEVVAEKIEIKKKIFDQIEIHRRPGSLVSTNTSGIPIYQLSEGRSADFKQHFLGTHFFNPPRYLKLLELIPTAETDPGVTQFLLDYGDRYLGKTTVVSKDTPAFIANRIGVYSIMKLLALIKDFGWSVDEVDRYTGVLIGRPKSATFRTADVVGLDTLAHVAQGIYESCPDDTERDIFLLPDFVKAMLEKRWLGDKTGQGFYKKIKDEKGQPVILSLQLDNLTYENHKKSNSTVFEQLKGLDDLASRLQQLNKQAGDEGRFFRASTYNLLRYCTHRIPEIADHIYPIDEALKAGFGWEEGPFETWDLIGFEAVLAGMDKEQLVPAPWIYEMKNAGHTAFYKTEKGVRYCYDILQKGYRVLPGQERFLVLKGLDAGKTLWKNGGLSVIDLGDGIIGCEFHAKMNTMGAEVMTGINKALDIAESDAKGLVVGNNGINFSAGANVGEIFMAAAENEWEELELAVKKFQDTIMRIRYSSIPVVAAPHQLALGGGCELCMHADFVQASAETYMGLVEFGVGIIPAGGGTKEFTLRASDEYREGEIDQNFLKSRFLTIASATVSTSAAHAAQLGYLKEGSYAVSMNPDRVLQDAKEKALELASAGYRAPIKRKDIKVLGRQGLGMVYIGANSMHSGHYISEYDKKLSEKLGWVMCGSDLSAPAQVSEQYLLDLERQVFLELIRERKTLERIQSILKTGRPLRN